MSTLHRDYSHYFCGSWVMLKGQTENCPFYVEDIYDGWQGDSEDYSEEHRAEIMLVGFKYFKRNNQIQSERVSMSVMNPALELESPDVGYVKVGNDIRWVAIRPVRQRMKGIVGNKIREVPVSMANRSSELMYDLFNPSFEGLVDKYTFICAITNKIYHKGVEAGDVTSAGYVLKPLFSYLRGKLSAAFPDIAINSGE